MRRFLAGPAGLACATILACTAGGGGGVAPPPGPAPTFQCSDSPAATDQVVLRCGAQVAAGIWSIDVVIGVPTTSTDINGFDFDVVFDPLLLAFVPGSAQPGNLLSRDGATPLLAAATATNPPDPGRLVVGIHNPAGSSGVGATAGYDLILVFRMKSQTLSPFGPELLRFENFRASDSSDMTIPGMTTSDQLLLSLR